MHETKKPASRKKTAATSKKANALGGGQPGLFAGQFGGFNINAIRISLEVIYALWRANGDLFASVREICTSVGAAGTSGRTRTATSCRRQTRARSRRRRC